MPQPLEEIALDLDATDDPIHGHQAGRFFHGYYDSYCYLPLYIFCGEHLLLAKLRPADIDAAVGSVKQVARIVERIRRRWPQVRIILRGDSGFFRDNLLVWCEENRVDYVFGLAKNKRLTKILGGVAPCRRQGGALGTWRQSAVRGHVAGCRAVGSAGVSGLPIHRRLRVVGRIEQLIHAGTPRELDWTDEMSWWLAQQQTEWLPATKTAKAVAAAATPQSTRWPADGDNVRHARSTSFRD